VNTPRLTRLLRPVLALAVAGGLLAAAAPADAASGARRPGDDFVIASFNVLGADHTDGKVGRHERAGYAGSAVRMQRAIEVLQQTNVDLVGFQELQDPQAADFRAAVGAQWHVFSGSSDTDNSIAWRTSRFRLVQGWTVRIPYFHGTKRRMPVVKLRSLSTGRALYVMNTHNPADARGPARRWRARAVRIERHVTARLTQRHHAPVFLTGDMNDRAAFFCPFTRNRVMHSFIGGSHTRSGRCRPPAGAGIDWILGNRYVGFGTPRIDRSRLVASATDHPVVSSHVHLRG
jgi:endonuclease/exonuclease/phosphatase family metal-dependent hydrolase